MADRRSQTGLWTGLAPLRSLAPIWMASSLVLVVLVQQDTVPQDQLLLDPYSSYGLPWYTGLVSSLGVLGWTSATVVAACAGWLSRVVERRAASEMFFGGALLSTLLTLDDLFQLHIVVTKHLGIPKVSFYGLYAVLGLAWAIHNLQELRRSPYPVLIAAGSAMVTSVFVDRFGSTIGLDATTSLVAEDVAKFLGILAWATFFVSTAKAVGRSILVSVAQRSADLLPSRFQATVR